MDEMIEELKERRRDADDDAVQSHKVAPNSYGAGYDRGYLDVLDEFLNLVAPPSYEGQSR